MANYSEAQFLNESTTFFTYFDSIVSTINETMTENPTESTILSTILDSTTASGPKCSIGFLKCDDHTANPCNTANGICCTHDGKVLSCVCGKGFTGIYCHRKEIALSKGVEGVPLTAVISALIGVIVISLFVAVVVLQFKYYKKRKRGCQEDEESRNSRRVNPDIRRGDDASTRLLRAQQPGYSWRQSVNRSSHASQKLKELSRSMSISVPENLIEIGLSREPEKETDQTNKIGDGGGGGGETEGSERPCIDPVNSSSTAQLLHDKDPPIKAVHFDSESDVIHL